MSRWFRVYDELLDDPKVQRLAPALFKAWVNILCAVSRSGGYVPPLHDLAFMLRRDEDAVGADVDSLISAGLLDEDGEGVLRPHNWKNRQFQSDSSTVRVQRYRAKKKAGTRNVSETPSVTPPEAYTEAEAYTDTSSLRSDVERASAPAAPKKTKSDGRGTRLTAEWQPSAEDIDYAVKAGVPRPEIARMAEKFRNHWLGKTGAAGVKRDWAATWRNWVIGDCERRGWAPPVPIAVEPRGPPAPGLPTDADLRARYSIPHEAESESDTGEILSDRAGVHRLGDGIERRDKPELRYQPERRGGSGMASLGSLLPLAWRGAGSGRDGAEGHGEIGDGADAMARVVR